MLFRNEHVVNELALHRIRHEFILKIRVDCVEYCAKYEYRQTFFKVSVLKFSLNLCDRAITISIQRGFDVKDTPASQTPLHLATNLGI